MDFEFGHSHPGTKAQDTEPILLPPAPSYPLLGPPPRHRVGPDLPITDLVQAMTETLRETPEAEQGQCLRRFADQLNQRLCREGDTRQFYAYPTEVLERLQRQLTYQGRSAANLDDGQLWRHLARTFTLALRQREDGK